MILWFGDSFDQQEFNLSKLNASVDNRYSHDNLFDTPLGLMEVDTRIYDPSLDMIEYFD